ncbi:hypothetical protein [Anaerolentibacter hominis]|uniref:hypothetical protein n=1 Tax=Anaerolentibacter hominis TaxID=3079009 RepID=UPI0031B89A60
MKNGSSSIRDILERRQKNRGKKRRIFWIVSIVLAADILVMGFVFLAAYNGWLRLPDAIQARIDILPDARAKDGRLHDGTGEPVETGNFRVLLNQLPTLSQGERDLNLQYENPEENQYSARASVYLEETGELLGYTRRVDPGKYVENIRLSRELPAGDHPVTVRIELFEEKKPAGRLSLNLSIWVPE